MRNKHIVWSVLGFLLLFSLLFLFQTMNNSKPEPKDISIIVRDKDNENWAAMRSGIEQAASEMGAIINFITLTNANDNTEQMNMLMREADSGADAIILAAADYNETVSIDTVAKSIPIVCMESTVNSSKISSFITPDHYDMGSDLAASILKNTKKTKKILLLNEDETVSSILERRSGIISVFEKAGVQIVSCGNDLLKTKQNFFSVIEQTKPDAVVAPDTGTLEKAAEYLYEYKSENLLLYGMGVTNTIISFLEKQVIEETAVSNDFALGYLSVKTIMDILNGKKTDKKVTVTYVLINGQNMFEPDQQRFLFSVE